MAAVVLVVTGAMLVVSEDRVGVTGDEYGHLVRGLAFYWAPDTRLNWPHPPFAHAWVALPTVLTEAPVDFTKMRGWAKADFTEAVRGYWHRDYAAARAQLVAGRRMMMALLQAMALHVFFFCKKRMGPAAGVIGLTLVCSYTVLLAHAQLVTNDFPAALASLLVTTSLVGYLEKPGARSVALLALACGLAAVTKHSLVVVVGLASLVALAVTIARAKGRRARAGLRCSLHLALVGAVTWFTVCAVYRFDSTFLTVAAWNAKAPPANFITSRSKTAISQLPGPPSLVVPIPYTYGFGLSFVRAQNARGHSGYFLGRARAGSSPAYFAVLTAVKTPVGVLVLLAAGAVAWARRRWRVPRFVPICAVLLLSMHIVLSRSKINIGYRHATPTIPWMILLATWAAADLARRGPGGAPRRVLAWGAVGATIAGAAAAHPLFLGDFNVIGGGREGGLRINVAEEDWGQDALDLGRTLRALGAVEVHYRNKFGTPKRELAHLGIKVLGLKCKKRETGYVALHVKDLREMPKDCWSWLSDEPVAVINDHVFLWSVPGKKSPSGARKPAERPAPKAAPAPTAAPNDDDD